MPELRESLAVPSSKDEATAYARDARKNFEEWQAYNLANDVPVKVTGGEVYRWVEPEPPQRSVVDPNGKLFKSDEEWQIYLQRQKEDGKWVIDTVGQSLYNFWQSSAADAKEFSSSKATARSYLDTEEDKTAEITRQFKDFDNRASLLYDLMGDEQDFAMSADDQNIQNAAAREKGYLLPGRGLDYSPYVSGGPLSDILRPSLPNYVRPDYRLNGAVGLPGAQGFDDPDFDQNGLPKFAYGTGAQSDTWFPGAVPTAGLPGQLPRMDAPTWVSSVVDRMLFNLRDGNPANDGQPSGWDASRYGDWNTLVQAAKYPPGVPQSVTYQLYGFVQDTQDPSTLNWAQQQVGARPAPTPTDYTQTLTVQEQAALQEQARRDLETLMKLSGGGGTSTVRVGSSGGGGGGGGGSSATDYGARLGYESASADIDAQLAREKFELQKQLMLLQFALDNDPNNPELILKQKQLDESVRQFNATLAQKTKTEEQALQLQRAKTIADYGANPGDAVAREYFLRQGANPTGNAINIFSGQPTGQQMTLSEVMQANAPIVSPALQGSIAGTPVPEGGLPAAPPTEPPPVDEPQYAYGTRRPDPKVTPDGWTRASEFIAGDPQMPGMVNPEKIQMRVRDGRPQAKVTPLSQVMGAGRGMGRMNEMMGGGAARMDGMRRRGMPMFAAGTDAWRITQAVTGGTGSSTGGTANWDWMYQQPEEPVYSPTIDYSSLSQGQTSPWSPTTTTLSSPATTTPTGPVDANKDGLDDVTGWANGVIADPKSPSGYSYNGTPTLSNGALYTAPATTAPTAPEPVPDVPSFYWDGNQWSPNPEPAGTTTSTPATTSATPPPAATAPAAPAPPPPATTNPWDYIRERLKIPDGAVGNTINNPYLSEILNGNSPTALVENRNSPYYGMTMEQAALFEHWKNANPGPDTVGVGTGDFILYDKHGNPLPASTSNVVPNQAAAGILTEAELSRGVTQSVNPRLPGYRPPEGMPVGGDAARILGTIPGYTPPSTTLPVVQGGTATTPDGGGLYTLMAGDVKTPEGGYLRYNPLSMQYEPVIPQLTKITSAKEFYALPEDVKQKILSGQPTGYLLADAGTQWLSSLTNPSASFSPNHQLTEAEFRALPPDQQRALLSGDTASLSPDLLKNLYAPGSYQSPSQPESTTYGSPFWRSTGLATLPGAEPVSSTYGYESYMTPADWQTLFPPPPPPTPTPITPIYPPGYEPEATTPPATGGTTPPAGTTTPPPGGTTAPPPAGTTAPPPAGGTTTPASGQDALSQALAQLLGLSYGNQTYQNLPALQYAMGNLSGGEYDTISNTPVEVPGLGLSLPGASQMMNYDMLQKLIENGSFDLLNSLYTAGNLPLSVIMALAKSRAPLGSAAESTLIETI